MLLTSLSRPLPSQSSEVKDKCLAVVVEDPRGCLFPATNSLCTLVCKKSPAAEEQRVNAKVSRADLPHFPHLQKALKSIGSDRSPPLTLFVFYCNARNLQLTFICKSAALPQHSIYPPRTTFATELTSVPYEYFDSAHTELFPGVL